ILAAVKLKTSDFERLPNDRIFGGVDIGVRRDRSALVGTRRRLGERLKLALCQTLKPRRGELAGEQVDLAEVKMAILAAHQKFNFFVINYDPHQCEPIAQDLIKLGVPMEPVWSTSKSLQEMASGLLQLFNSEDIELYKNQELIDDLKKLRFIEKGGGYRIDSEPDEQGHADAATAFMLSILGDLHHPWA